MPRGRLIGLIIGLAFLALALAFFKSCRESDGDIEVNGAGAPISSATGRSWNV